MEDERVMVRVIVDGMSKKGLKMYVRSVRSRQCTIPTKDLLYSKNFLSSERSSMPHSNGKFIEIEMPKSLATKNELLDL